MVMTGGGVRWAGRWLEVTVLHLLLLASRMACQGALQCLCTTPECLRNRDVVCTTDSLCYVQYTPGGPNTYPSQGSQIVRGCIDGRTPLLCENKRPEIYSGPWPILLCCNTHLCNKDAVPTLPPWAADISEETTKKNRSVDIILPLDVSSGDTELTRHKAPSRGHSINPLYIGVPAAGACVLLAVIIFAVYILRRQNQMYEQHYYHRNRMLKRAPHLHQPIMTSPCPNGCRYVTMVTGNDHAHVCHGHHACATAYTDCDRSSNGSESRLLAPV